MPFETNYNQDILKEKLPNVAQDTTQIQRRNKSHNHVSVGLQLDEDNALVASEEEDETSSSLVRYENDGIDLESDRFPS